MGDGSNKKCYSFLQGMNSGNNNITACPVIESNINRNPQSTGLVAQIKICKFHAARFIPAIKSKERGRLNARRWVNNIFWSSQVVDRASDMCSQSACPYQWRKTILGHTFSISRMTAGEGEGSMSTIANVGSWFQTNEEFQVMVASVLVIVGIWWLVRTLLSLLINLVFPFLVVMIAVILVPQLRNQLLGQNYPVFANKIRELLLKLAETIKAE